MAYVLQHSGLTFPKSAMMSEKAKMKVGFKENEKKFNPIIDKTYTSVMQSINNQKQSHKTQMKKILQQKKIPQIES